MAFLYRVPDLSCWNLWKGLETGSLDQWAKFDVGDWSSNDRKWLDFDLHKLQQARPRVDTSPMFALLLLGHSKLDGAVRYLGIDIDDVLEISEKIDV